ncbi:YtxH domain-containing protein [Peribacillus sp. SCS-37]|uniref:YtxH domain-containing protein n=1 Tax=Paraperibacillus esterisolvens TaxID=3115296 RepID=UPI003906B6EA
MTQQSVVVNGKKNNLMVRGLIIGGVIGAALALMDKQTRKSVKTTAGGLKDSSVGMISQVKENPGEVKEQMMTRFKAASESLKDAMSEAQNLYEMVNREVFGKVSDVKDITNDAVSMAKLATDEIKEIGSKVAEAGQKLTGGEEGSSVSGSQSFGANGATGSGSYGSSSLNGNGTAGKRSYGSGSSPLR